MTCANGHDLAEHGVYPATGACRVCVREKQREYDTRLRAEAIRAYGDGSCARCGHRPGPGERPLELDHVNGDGREHRLALGGLAGGTAFAQRLRARGWPTDPPLQTLCHDCHVIKTREDRDAHRTASA